MKTLKLVMVGIAVILCFVAVPLTAKGAQEEAAVEKEYVLKFNHVLNQNDPFHKAFVKWSEAVAERTGGKMKVEVFPLASVIKILLLLPRLFSKKRLKRRVFLSPAIRAIPMLKSS